MSIYLVLVLYIESLTLFYIFIQGLKSAKSKILFVPKNGSRVLKLSLFISLYYRRKGVCVFLFLDGGLLIT